MTVFRQSPGKNELILMIVEFGRLTMVIPETHMNTPYFRSFQPQRSIVTIWFQLLAENKTLVLMIVDRQTRGYSKTGDIY